MEKSPEEKLEEKVPGSTEPTKHVANTWDCEYKSTSLRKNLSFQVLVQITEVLDELFIPWLFPWFEFRVHGTLKAFLLFYFLSILKRLHRITTKTYKLLKPCSFVYKDKVEGHTAEIAAAGKQENFSNAYWRWDLKTCYRVLFCASMCGDINWRTTTGEKTCETEKGRACWRGIIPEILLPSADYKYEAIASVDKHSALIAAKVLALANGIADDVRSTDLTHVSFGTSRRCWQNATLLKAAEIYPATVYGRKYLYFDDFPSLPVISDLSDDGSDIFSIDDGLLKTADSMDAGCIHAKDREAARSEIAVCGAKDQTLCWGFTVNARDNIANASLYFRMLTIILIACISESRTSALRITSWYSFCGGMCLDTIHCRTFPFVTLLEAFLSSTHLQQFLRKHLSTDGGCDKHTFLSKTVPADIDTQIQLEDKSSTNPSVASGIPGSVAVSLTTAAGKTLLQMCCIVQWDLNGNLNYQKAGKSSSSDIGNCVCQLFQLTVMDE
ncbi:hypothetical protein SELMODRAFT_406375 [Selaginella moellendorffii]|uniref:Uncharacterized protein n=1 Tax=Selaginella moellendorffii TaxID=88036 RepID=D8R260_SELML|nr:hypothetical protein SELMODRAFT_406375 [Selaginella moellendorffii]